MPVKLSKTITEKVDASLALVLEGEDCSEILQGLSGAELQYFYELIDKMRSGEMGNIPEIKELWKVDYSQRPPGIKEFIEDPKFLGQTLLPSEDSSGIFPVWRDMICQDFDLDSRIHNLVITGSLGTGKTYVGTAIFLYRIVLATMLRNPQAFFGLGLGSKIVYTFLSVTRATVTETAFGDAMNFMAYSPYFRETLGYNPDRKYADSRVQLGNSIEVTAGSKGHHIIGRNSMGVFMDEGNFRLEANPDEKAYKLYDEIRTRIANRFQRSGGFLPSISILASSARDESSFTEKVIGDIEKANDPLTQKVYRKAVYQVRDYEGRGGVNYKPFWFKVSYGLKNSEPYILKGWYTKTGTPVKDPKTTKEEIVPVGEDLSGHEQPPPGSNTELVPMDYLVHFQRNCRTNLQSLAGISTGGNHRLFQSTMDLEIAIELGKRDPTYLNPATTTLIPISMEDNKNIWDYLVHKTFVTKRSSMFGPLRHPESLRFAHLDLATRTMAGVSICHLVGNELVEGLVNPMTGETFSEYRLVVEYDFILTIVAGRAKPISLEKIQNFFFWLRDICHFKFGLVSADQFQSESTLQMMESRGFSVGKLSMDRNKAPYYGWRTAFEERRIRMFHQSQLMTEAEQLVDLPEKIDHLPTQSKDTSDATAGAYWNAVQSAATMATRTSQSSPGLYRDQEEESEAPPPIYIPLPPQERRIGKFIA